jgi:hypothetical protein
VTARRKAVRFLMSRVVLNTILDCVFRPNAAYELVPFDRLTQDQQALLRELTNDPKFYGILLPRTPGACGIKSVCRDTAALLNTLLQPGMLPRDIQQSLGDRANEVVAKLVLDCVLEMEQAGRFVCGPEAYPLICASHPDPEPQGVVASLSRSALEYGQALEIDDVSRLAARLYFYNRIPLTPYWTRRLSSEDAVLDFLGISASSNLEHILKNWMPIERRASSTGWLQWRSRRHRSAPPERQHGYKLYVSPQPDALPDAFRAVAELLDGSSVYSFKVGCDPIGLLRPDKLVLYFWDFEPLEQVARELAVRLSGCAAHGTPFTAAIDDTGLLSWGIDPLPEKGAPSWQGPESWRTWITNRLASFLVLAGNAPRGPLQPWRFALERLRLENVDTVAWAPTQDFGVAAD